MSWNAPFRAIIMGAPGSGKGTIAARIVKRFNIKHISSGDILRRNIDEKTHLGLNAEKYMNAGALVPDSEITAAIMEETRKIHGSFLLDGFPRTYNQARALWEVTTLDCVINLIVPYDIIIDRVKKRWIHPGSGRVYNLDFNPPKTPFKDDLTGEKLVQRADDDPDLLLKRLKTYDTMNKPIVDFFKVKNIISDFEGKSSDEIWPKVQTFLEKMDKI